MDARPVASRKTHANGSWRSLPYARTSSASTPWILRLHDQVLALLGRRRQRWPLEPPAPRQRSRRSHQGYGMMASDPLREHFSRLFLCYRLHSYRVRRRDRTLPDAIAGKKKKKKKKKKTSGRHHRAHAAAQGSQVYESRPAPTATWPGVFREPIAEGLLLNFNTVAGITAVLTGNHRRQPSVGFGKRSQRAGSTAKDIPGSARGDLASRASASLSGVTTTGAADQYPGLKTRRRMRSSGNSRARRISAE